MSLERAKEHLKKYGVEEKVKEVTVSTATVVEAAKAVGCIEAMIAKTLSFDVSGKTILILMAGDSKVDNSKYKKEYEIKAKMLQYDEVEERVGHKVGGVCPFGINEGVEVYLDESLKRFEKVYPACGSNNSFIELTIKELEKYSDFVKWVKISKV